MSFSIRYERTENMVNLALRCRDDVLSSKKYEWVKWERESKRQRQRERVRDRETHTEKERQRERDRERHTERKRDTEIERDRERETDTEREREGFESKTILNITSSKYYLV